MLQALTTVFFTFIGAGAVLIIVTMLQSNASPIWSALVGRGAFPLDSNPQHGLAPAPLPLRRHSAGGMPHRPRKMAQSSSYLSRAA